MKILKLHLSAFGPFTGASVDLSSGQEGLHIIYGPNEAGKSSALRAITDFFYGIHPRTPDDFVHPYTRLRIGTQLKHSDGTVLDLIRRKANRNSLRLGDDATPWDESEMSRFLGDVDRDLFQMMFGIDHERLRRGGEEIVHGGGRIGELLFAAGAGLADLQQIRTQLQAEMDDLLTAPGRSGAIATGIKEFKEIHDRVKQAQVSVETWSRLDEDLRAAQQQKRTLDDTIREKHSEQNRLKRIRDAVSAIGHWRKAGDELAQLRDAPLLAEDFADTSNAILIELRKAEQREGDAQTTIARLDDQLKTVHIPETLIRESDAIEALRDRLGGYRKAMSDRPKLETSRELAEGEAKEILRRLGRTPDLSSIEDLRLPAEKTIRIQNLGNQQEGLLERLQAARRDCERIRRNIARAEDKLREIRIPEDATRLRSTLRDIQQEGDLESQVERDRKEMQGLEQTARVAISRLPLWSGTVEEAERLPVPSLVTVEKFDDAIKEKRGRLQTLRDRLQEEADQRRLLEAELGRLESEQAVPTKDELDAMRRLREQGWQLVLQAWEGGEEDSSVLAAFLQEFPSAESLKDAYRSSVERADRIADLLRTDADRVATKAKLQADRGRRLARETAIEADIERAEADWRHVEDRWRATWEPLGILPLSPTEMRDWLHQHQEIAQAAKNIRARGLDADHLQRRIDSLFDELASALKQVEPEYTDDDRSLRKLSLSASSKCDEMQKAESLLEQITDGLKSDRSDLADAESRFAESESALSKWQSDWAAEMLSLRLEDDAMPSQANSVLADIGSLFRKYQEADHLRTRLEGIDREAREFEDEVRSLAGRIAPDLAAGSVKETVSSLAERLQAARSAEEKRDSLLQQRDEQQEKMRKATEQVSEIHASLDEMCRQADCPSHDRLSEAARRSSRRRALERSVRDLEEQITSQSGGAGLEPFVAEVANEAAEVDSLQPRIDELDESMEHLRGERDTCLRRIERAESELQRIDGSDLAAESAADGESIASRLDDQVRELAVLRVASAVLHAGIEQHRKNHQGPVLGRASRIFHQITCGRFEALRADFSERGEPVLTGVRSAGVAGAGGQAIPVSGMSDGTCDQLYLALRLASLETWLDRHEPIPFIVDDVLLHFDDERAVAGLQVLAELSHRTQVIFFTHHHHLVEMARNSLSSQDLFVTTLVDGAIDAAVDGAVDGAIDGAPTP